MNFALLKPEEIETYWEKIEPFLLAVINNSFGELDLNGLKKRLTSGTEGLLCAINSDGVIVSICVMNTIDFETGKRVLELPYVGGIHMDLWLEDGFDVIKGIARNLGCTHLRGCGRRGWARVVPELREIRTAYELELHD